MSQRIGYVQQNAGCTSSTITTQHTYDSSGNPITAMDGDGHLGCTLSSGSTQYSGCAFYDGFDTHLTRALNAKNQAITYRYDTTTASAGYGQWLMSSTDANGQTTVYSYDTLGRLTSVVKPGDTQAYPTTSYTYINTCTVGATNPCLELDTTTRVTSGSNTTTTTRQWYDGMGRLVETQAPGPNQFSKLPAVGSVLLTYTYYDDMGRESTQSLPYAIAASATVNYASPNWNQARTQTSYDSLGRPVGSVTYGDGSTIVQSSTISYTVAQGLPSFSVDTSTAFEQTITQDAYNHQTVTYMDALGRNRYAQVFDGTSSPYTVVRTIQYNQDEVGNLLSTVTFDANSKVQATSSSTYDGLQRVTGWNDSDEGSCANTPLPASCSTSSDTAWKMSYDADGNVLSQTDPRNQTTYASYDALDRPLCRGTTSAQVNPCQNSAYATFFYDSYDTSSNSGVSFPSGCTAPSGTSSPVGETVAETFSSAAGNGWRCAGFDARGETTASTLSVTAKSQTTTQTILQSYNDVGTPTTLTYPDGEIVTSTYDNNDYFRSMSTANGALVSAVQYTNAGQLAGMTVGGVAYQGTVTTPVQVSLGYDSIQRPISTSVSVNGNTLFNQQQTYDNVGNVIQLSTTLPSSSGGSLTDNQAFCYDALNRLVWAGNSGTPPGDDSCGASPGGSTTASYSQSFSYDALDRMTSGPAGTETYGNTSHVHAATTLSSLPNAYASYDAMGNMTCRNVSTSSSQSCGSGTQTGATMTYDNEGRLSTWTAPKGSTGSEQYLYDNEGNRVLQQQSTSTGTTSVITFDGYTDTTISNGSKSTTKYYHADGQTVAEVTGTAWYVLVPDLLGSAVLALRSDGSVQAMQLYTPYGSSRYSMGTMPTAYNFTGQRFDSQTGLLYYNARYYDPMSGRFTSGDTVLNNSSGMDPYAYVGDNPTSATDPTGHLLIEGGEGGGGGEAGDAGGDGDGDAGVGGGGGDSGGLVDVTTATGGTEVLEPGAVPDLSGSQGNVTAEYNPNDGTVMTVTNNADGSTTTTSLNPGDPGYEDAMNIASGMASFPDETSDAEANPESWGIEGGSTEAPPSEPASPPSKAAVAPSTGGSEPAAAPEATGSSEPAAAPEATGSSEPATESNGKCSFTAQTKVATQNGSQAIGTLKVGEKVRAYNPKTKKVQEEPILHVWIHQDNDLVDLTITHVTHARGVKPSSEVIHTNKKHPFLTVEKGFLPVGQIKLEMHVVEADGQLGVITGWKLVPGVKTMYNLEVAQDHTFVVGVGMWVVHNCTDPEAGSWLRESSLNNAPRQTTPGTSVISGEHVNDLGQIEPYEAHYDEYGRQIGRTDYTGGNATEGIPPIHYHATIYTPDFPAGLDLPPALDHGPGEYSPGSRGLFYLL